jgi:hypothetical protein
VKTWQIAFLWFAFAFAQQGLFIVKANLSMFAFVVSAFSLGYFLCFPSPLPHTHPGPTSKPPVPGKSSST